MSELKELVKEAKEIIINAKAAFRRGEITRNQRDDVIANTMKDVAIQLEIIPQHNYDYTDR